MRVNKIICDGCGKEIVGDPIQVYAIEVNRKNPDDAKMIYDSQKDFCNDCLERIKHFIELNVVKESQPVPVVSVGGGHDTKEETEKAVQSELTETTKAPTVKDLILQGQSKEETCRVTGCKPGTYDQVKYQLKKKGLLPNNSGKTVRCSEVHDTCVYADKKDNQCDYIGTTGKMRGCPAESCNKYIKK